MAKIILSVNAGSSSVKISAYLAEKGAEPRQLAETQMSGLTAPPPQLDYVRGSKNVYKDKGVKETVASQTDAFKILLNTLIDDSELPEIQRKEDIAIITHRIVHGGDYDTHKVITDETYHHLEELNELAPLHNVKSLEIIESCIKTLLPSTVNVAHFDTQFHHTLPQHIFTYPIDPAIATKNHLRKYGFHGISYAYILRATARFVKKPVEETSIIALHLGSGASACAIKNGKSWDTSMGLTPLAGLPGATRSGSVDPSLVFHYASDVGRLSPNSTRDLHISRAEEILNKEAGWKSLTGTTDFGTIVSGASEGGDPQKKLAFDIFVDRIRSFVGSYYVTLEGKVDALVFSGGIGEKSAHLRAEVARSLACIGFEVDEVRNESLSEETVTDVSKDGTRHRTLVCRTDEQFEMAKECAEDESFW